jgi:F0F1-type ATP synthase assembly protein I
MYQALIGFISGILIVLIGAFLGYIFQREMKGR